MILIENINIQNDFSEYQAMGSRMDSMAGSMMVRQEVMLEMRLSGADATRVVAAINSDGTVYPDKIVAALLNTKGISNNPITPKELLTRGIDL